MVENIKEWFKNHMSIVAGILLLLLCFKSCQSCTQQRAYGFTTVKSEKIIDSLQHTVNVYADSIKTLNIKIEHLNSDVDKLNTSIKDLKETMADLRSDKKTLNEINRTNAKAIKNLTNYDNKEE